MRHAGQPRAGRRAVRQEQRPIVDPKGATSFELADAAEQRWLADLQAAGLPDRRPRWLRPQWRRTDEAARIDVTGVAA